MTSGSDVFKVHTRGQWIVAVCLGFWVLIGIGFLLKFRFSIGGVAGAGMEWEGL